MKFVEKNDTIVTFIFKFYEAQKFTRNSKKSFLYSIEMWAF